MKRKRRARSIRSFWWRSGVEISDTRQKTKDFVFWNSPEAKLTSTSPFTERVARQKSPKSQSIVFYINLEPFGIHFRIFPIFRIQPIFMIWCQRLRLGPYLPHAPGVRMTVVNKLTPSNNYVIIYNIYIYIIYYILYMGLLTPIG